MTSLVMLTRNRPRLTEQALRSIYRHTDKSQFNLTVMDDGSDAETQQILWSFMGPVYGKGAMICSHSQSIGILGFLRNVGAETAEKVFGRSEWICFLDNDVAVFDGWLDRLIEASPRTFAVLGGERHPYHQVNGKLVAHLHPLTRESLRGWMIEETDAVAGYSMFMSWATWQKFGPFDAHAKGLGQSEDFALCQKVKKAGGIVGYIHPPVLAHCGIVDSFGKPAVGAEAFKRVPGLLYE